jgi:hypothetical protein
MVDEQQLVASIEHDQLKTHAVHPFLNPADVLLAIRLLFEAVTSASLPFAAARLAILCPILRS